MAPHASRSISQDSDGTVIVTERRYGCYCWGLVMSALILAFVLIVSVVLLVDGDRDIDGPALLGGLLAVLIVVAGVAFFFIEWQRRKALARRDAAGQGWVNSTLESRVDSPTAPPASGRTSWVHWAPWQSAATAGRAPDYSATPTAPPKGYTDYDF